MKLLITAAEPSADRLGAAVMRELKTTHPTLQFYGVGGEEMKAEGLNELFPQSDINVMGLAEVLPHIPTILRRIRELAKWTKLNKPAAVLTIDAQDFSALLGKKLRSKNKTLPIIQYGSPTVWAWRPGRAKKLATYLTHLLTLFPFEDKYYAPYNLPTTYVGHPAVPLMEEVALSWGTRHTGLAPQEERVIPAEAGIHSPKNRAQRTVLALLPGSRPQELEQHWPVMLETYRTLRKAVPQLSAILVLPNQSYVQACRDIADWKGEGISTAFGENRFQALASATAALAKSGTNNLEMALLGTPAVVCYRMKPLTYVIARFIVKTRYISLPNIILGQTVYPEFIQNAATSANLAAALLPLLGSPAGSAAQTRKLTELRLALATPQPPAAMAASVIRQYL